MTLGEREPGASAQRGLHERKHPAGAPPLDWWVDSLEVVERRLVLSMCPQRVCRVCGEPSRRIVEHERTIGIAKPNAGRGEGSPARGGPLSDEYEVTRATLGWTDCGHDDYRPGEVLSIGGTVGARFIVGDCLETLRTLPDNSVDLVLSSPPFLALRSYLPADHPDKGKEIGSEPTPGEFIDTLLDVVVECRRVLAPHGSLVFELGDTYAGSGGAGGDYNAGGMREGAPGFNGSMKYARTHDPAIGPPIPRVSGTRGAPGGTGWPLDKSLCLIPQSFAWALSYGRNPFTGRTIEPWRVRNIIVWARPNPPVGALGDKFRPATSYLTVAAMGRDRYFDLDAVREVNPNGQGVGKPAGVRTGEISEKPLAAENGGNHRMPIATSNPAGAPPLDYWVIPTAPYKGSHYATFPPALCVKPILAMCPQRVCRVCGEPSRRITEHTRYASGQPLADGDWYSSSGVESHSQFAPGANKTTGQPSFSVAVETLGWTDCGHDDYRPGVVLDPFAGSGTTLMVATGHGRDAIGVDLDPRNADLARERCGLFLEVEVLNTQGAA